MARSSSSVVSALAVGLWLCLAGRAAAAPPAAHTAAPADRRGAAPPAYTTTAPITRMVMIRLRNGTDVLDGLNQGIAEQKVRNAVIVGGFGSVIRYHVHVVGTQDLPTRDVFTKVDRPQDVLNVSGYVIDGRLHPHMTLADEKVAAGGHVEPGTEVLTFLNVALAVLPDDASLARFDDWQWK
ncbi:MAG TPA: PPC domain-containing DNA-binding protein [Vicinamibacteria bacterium]